MDQASIPIAYASETGFTEEVAERTQEDLQDAGVATHLLDFAELGMPVLRAGTAILLVVSTTGDGDPPLPAEAFSENVMSASPDLALLRYGLMSAGDSIYPEFCGFGHRLHAWLQAAGAHALFEPVDVDCEDEAAVAWWRRQVIETLGRERSPQHLRA